MQKAGGDPVASGQQSYDEPGIDAIEVHCTTMHVKGAYHCPPLVFMDNFLVLLQSCYTPLCLACIRIHIHSLGLGYTYHLIADIHTPRPHVALYLLLHAHLSQYILRTEHCDSV